MRHPHVMEVRHGLTLTLTLALAHPQVMEVRHGARQLPRRAARLRLRQSTLWQRREVLAQLTPGIGARSRVRGED